MKLAYRILRKYRGYILPSHRRTFREVLERGRLRPGDEKRRFVFFDFSSTQIDIDAGRYSFALVRDFEEAGYTACYRASFPFLSSMRYKRYKELLLEREFRVCDSPEELPDRSLAAIVTDRKKMARQDVKLLRVSYDHRWPSAPGEVIMPFRVYPGLYGDLEAVGKIDLEKPRAWRIFFAGTATLRYGRPILEKEFGKMSRLAILDTAREKLKESELQILNSEKEKTAEGPRFVMAGPTYRIPQKQWLATLAKSDFFLACPGGAMPICHNLVETMAVGAVPILEYPEYLEPKLKDGVNCLAFSGAEDLIKTMRRALQMKAQEIARLRTGAVEYYRKYLAPGLFAKDVMAAPERELTLLFASAHARRS